MAVFSLLFRLMLSIFVWYRRRSVHLYRVAEMALSKELGPIVAMWKP